MTIEMRALIVCVGNTLAGDDAAACAVHEQLSQEPLPMGVSLHWLGTSGVDLLELLQGEDLLIVVDAVQLGAAPGTLHALDWDDLPEPAGQAVSLHGIGVREIIELGRALYPQRMPRQVLLIGIEGKSFNELGEPLTAEVAETVPAAVELIKRRLEDLHLHPEELAHGGKATHAVR